jgi:hypothetical protein
MAFDSDAQIKMPAVANTGLGVSVESSASMR